MNPNEHKWSKKNIYIYIKIWSNWANFCEQLWVLRSRFQHPKNVLALPLPRQEAPWAHQNMRILRWAAIKSSPMFPYVAWYSPGIPWLSSVFHVVSMRETKVFSCQHQTRVLERNLQNVNLPCITTARILRKCQNVQPFFVSTRNMPTDSFAIRKSDWNGHQSIFKMDIWILFSSLYHCVVSLGETCNKLPSEQLLLSASCFKFKTLDTASASRRRGVSASRRPGWKIRFAAHAGPPQTLQHLKGQQRAILAGSQHFTSKVERLLKDLYEMLKKESGRIWAPFQASTLRPGLEVQHFLCYGCAQPKRRRPVRNKRLRCTQCPSK